MNFSVGNIGIIHSCTEPLSFPVASSMLTLDDEPLGRNTTMLRNPFHLFDYRCVIFNEGIFGEAGAFE